MWNSIHKCIFIPLCVMRTMNTNEEKKKKRNIYWSTHRTENMSKHECIPMGKVLLLCGTRYIPILSFRTIHWTCQKYFIMSNSSNNNTQRKNQLYTYYCVVKGFYIVKDVVVVVRRRQCNVYAQKCATHIRIETRCIRYIGMFLVLAKNCFRFNVARFMLFSIRFFFFSFLFVSCS